MELILAETLKNAMLDMGEECRIYDNYSGRGMRGKSTTGIVVDNITDLITAILVNAYYFVNSEGESIFEDINYLKIDNLGMKTIIY